MPDHRGVGDGWGDGGRALLKVEQALAPYLDARGDDGNTYDAFFRYANALLFEDLDEGHARHAPRLRASEPDRDPVSTPKPGDYIFVCLHAHERETQLEKIDVRVTFRLPSGVEVELESAHFVLCEECRELASTDEFSKVPCAIGVVGGEGEEPVAVTGRMVN